MPGSSVGLDEYAELLDEVFPAEYLHAHNLWTSRKPYRRFIFQAIGKVWTVRGVGSCIKSFRAAIGLGRKTTQAATTNALAGAGSHGLIDARIRACCLRTDRRPEAGNRRDRRDMAGPLSMNRLLQGEVGSGKTVVAVYAISWPWARISGRLDGPTEVLARQHVLTLDKLLA